MVICKTIVHTTTFRKVLFKRFRSRNLSEMKQTNTDDATDFKYEYQISIYKKLIKKQLDY